MANVTLICPVCAQEPGPTASLSGPWVNAPGASREEDRGLPSAESRQRLSLFLTFRPQTCAFTLEVGEYKLPTRGALKLVVVYLCFGRQGGGRWKEFAIVGFLRTSAFPCVPLYHILGGWSSGRLCLPVLGSSAQV